MIASLKVVVGSGRDKPGWGAGSSGGGSGDIKVGWNSRVGADFTGGSITYQLSKTMVQSLVTL